MRHPRHSLSETIGTALKNARQRRAWSQAEVAERVGIAAEVYGRLERGRIVPRADTLVRLAVALEVTADTLLGLAMGNEAPQPPPEVATEDDQAALLRRRETRRLLRRLDAASPRTLQLLDLLLGAIQKDAARGCLGPRKQSATASKRRR